MKKSSSSAAYLPATTVLAELNRMVLEVSAVGVLPDRTTVGGSFSGWSAGLERGQTGWIYSLEQFHSITELVAYNESMAGRGVTVRSVREPWFNDPSVSSCALLGHLFRLGESIHDRWQPLRSVSARRPVGFSQVQRAVELRVTHRLSVVAACRMAGCGVNVYYRYLKQQGEQR